MCQNGKKHYFVQVRVRDASGVGGEKRDAPDEGHYEWIIPVTIANRKGTQNVAYLQPKFLN